MSLEKAIKIVTIIDGDGVTKAAQKAFDTNLKVIRFYTKTKTLEKIAEKANKLVTWVADEIIKAKANDIYEALSEEEIDFALNNISHPTMVKLMETITRPTDAYHLQVNALELELVGKFIDLIKEEDEVLGKNIEDGLKDFTRMGAKPKSALN